MAFPRLSAEESKRTRQALRRCGWNQVHAALDLNIGLEALKTRIRTMRTRGINVPTARTELRTKAGGLAKKLTEAESRAVAAEKRADALQADVKRLRSARLQPVPKPKIRRAEKEDRVIVIWPDVHGAKQDQAAVAAFLGDVKRLDPDEGVGLGDLADCGGFLGAHHVLGFVAETSDTYEEDIEASNKFLDAFQASAPRAGMRLIEGNHEHRVEKWAITTTLRSPRDSKWMRDRVAPDVLLRVKERGARYYRRAETYDGMPVQGATRIGKLGIMHGLLNGNGAPDAVLNKFAMNMVYGHTHKMQSRVKRTGVGMIGAWNLGTLAKLQQFYAHGAPTDHAHGYGVVFMARSGLFQMVPVSIVDGVSLLPEMKV